MGLIVKAGSRTILNTTAISNAFAKILSFHRFETKTRGLTEIQEAIAADSNFMGSRNFFDKLWVANLCINKNAAKIAAVMTSITNEKGNFKAQGMFELLTGKSNARFTAFELWRWCAAFYQIEGDLYIREVKIGKTIKELQMLFSTAMEPIEADGKADDSGNERGDGYVKFYKYTPGTKQKEYETDEILQISTFNPNSMIKGLSWLHASQLLMDTSVDAATYQSNLLKRGAFPTLHMDIPDIDIPQPKIDEIREGFKKRSTGPTGDPVLWTWGGTKATPLSMKPIDLQILQSQEHTAASIAALLGVPPELIAVLGSDTKTYENLSESKKMWVESTILPTCSLYLRKINARYGTDFAIDQDKIPELRPGAEELERSYWLTPNQKRERQGLQIDRENEAMDKYWFPVNLENLDTMMDRGLEERAVR